MRALNSCVSLLLLAAAPSPQNWLSAPQHYGEFGSRFVAAADLDGDGDLDAVALSFPDSSTYRIFENDGAGELSAGLPQPMTSGYDYLEVVQARLDDLTGDGRADFIVSVWNGPAGPGVEVRPGDGVGGFGDPVFLALERQARLFAVGDSDGNGVLDLATGNQTDVYSNAVIRWWRWNGSGFDASAPLTLAQLSPASMAAIDLENDGVADLAIGYFTSQPISSTVLLARSVGGDPVLAEEIELPQVGSTLAMQLVATDFEGDGLEDLMLVGRFSFFGDLQYSILPFYNSGGALQLGQAQAFGSLEDSWDEKTARLADWDADGDLDLFLHDGGGNIMRTESFLVFENTGGEAYGLGPRVLMGDIGKSAAVADFDGDGKLDYLGPQSLFFGEGVLPASTKPGASPRQSVATDWDGDGDVDLMGPSGRYQRNDGTGDFTLTTQFVPPLSGDFRYQDAVAMADFNADGGLDLVVPLYDSPDPFTSIFQAMRLLSSDGVGGIADLGNAAVRSEVIEAASSLRLNPVADVDGDGSLDILGRDGYWLNDGSGYFGVKQGGIFGEPVGAADLDADLDTDVVTLDASSTELWLHRQDAGAFTSELLATAEYGFFERFSRILDLEGDGLLDLAIGNNPAGELELFHNQGGVFVRETLVADDFDLGLIDLVDVDGDGLDDLVAGPHTSVYPTSRLLVWRREPGPGQATFEPVRRYLGNSMFVAADIDGDGDRDFAGGSTTLGRSLGGPDGPLLRQYGPATAGAGGVEPLLGASGPATVGSTSYALRLRFGRGGAPGLIAVGAAEALLPDVPFPGMTTSIDSLLFLIPIVASGPAGAAGAGSYVLPFLPVPGIEGLSFYHQVILVDPAAVSGWSESNALQVRYAAAP